ncbi:MAG TPA: hypothetical protein VM299_01930, partial [Solirubrobacteraceae bacterium]|nr:hypothetical protein [Solirubrobacteraceae bacterium]
MVASTLAFLLGALLAALAAAPSQAALKAVSPDVDPNTGFPLWYQDRSDETLELCLDPFNCANPAPDSTAPPSIVAGEGDNFPGEAFYWSAEAIMDTPGGRCRLVLALEAAFNNETESPEPGDQLVFNRIRVRCDGLRANSDFTVTHPFGRETFRTNGEGEFSSSRVRADDTGCQATPCDFSLALADPSPTRTFGPFLRWDSSAPAAPAGYIGNPFVEHRITGSPMGTNLFRVEGPGIVGGLTQNLFALEGKINTHSS